MIVIAHGSFVAATNWRDGLLDEVDQSVQVRPLGDGPMERARWSIETEELMVRDAAHRLMCSGLLTSLSVFTPDGEQIEPDWLLTIGHVLVETPRGAWVTGIAAGSSGPDPRRIRVCIPGSAPLLVLSSRVQPVSPEPF